LVQLTQTNFKEPVKPINAKLNLRPTTIPACFRMGVVWLQHPSLSMELVLATVPSFTVESNVAKLGDNLSTQEPLETTEIMETQETLETMETMNCKDLLHYLPKFNVFPSNRLNNHNNKDPLPAWKSVSSLLPP